VGYLGGEERKDGPCFHASVDEIGTVSVLALHAPEPGQDMVLFADSLFCPFNGDIVIASEDFHPVAVVIGALTQDLLGDRRHVQDLTEKVDGLFRPGQAAEVSVDDNAVEAVVYKSQ